MKICLVSPRFYPMLAGSGNSAFLLAAALASRGHEVHVFTDGRVGKVNVPEHSGLHVHPVERMEEYNTGKEPDSMMEGLILEISSLEPDVVHVWNIMMMHFIGSVRKCISAPIVFTYQNTYIPNTRAAGIFEDPVLDLEFTRNVFLDRKYDRIVATSKHYVKFANDMGIDDTELVFSYLGIDIEQYNNEEHSPKSMLAELMGHKIDTELLLCMPGRVVERKGVDVAIRAIGLLQRKNIPCKLLLTDLDGASTQYHRYIHDLIGELGLNSSVVTPRTYISNAQMPSLYKCSDIALALSSDEGFGLTALEALASGTPLVATQSSGYNEFLKTEENALIVERSPEAVANAIVRIHDSPELKKTLRDTGIVTAKRFDIRRHAIDMENIYMELLHART